MLQFVGHALQSTVQGMIEILMQPMLVVEPDQIKISGESLLPKAVNEVFVIQKIKIQDGASR